MVDVKALVLCTTHIETDRHMHTCAPNPTYVFIIHQCQCVILDELTVVAIFDACVSESLNKNEHGEAVCLSNGTDAGGVGVGLRGLGFRPRGQRTKGVGSVAHPQ